MLRCLHSSPLAKWGVRQQPIKQVSDSKEHVWMENPKVSEAFAPNLFCRRGKQMPELSWSCERGWHPSAGVNGNQGMTKTLLRQRMSWLERLYKRKIKSSNRAGRSLRVSESSVAYPSLCRGQMQQFPIHVTPSAAGTQCMAWLCGVQHVGLTLWERLWPAGVPSYLPTSRCISWL